MSTRALPAIVALLLTAAVYPNQGSASQWGCEVLLCAASSNPSWRSVPACHPPMNRLISEMKKRGFSWPTCPEGGTGAPGYERYADCPEGYKVASSRERDGDTRSGDLCVQTVNFCQNNRHGPYNSDRPRGCIQTISISRPLRSQPYYFDVKNDTSDQTQRHWFSLNR